MPPTPSAKSSSRTRARPCSVSTERCCPPNPRRCTWSTCAAPSTTTRPRHRHDHVDREHDHHTPHTPPPQPFPTAFCIHFSFSFRHCRFSFRIQKIKSFLNRTNSKQQGGTRADQCLPPSVRTLLEHHCGHHPDSLRRGRAAGTTCSSSSCLDLNEPTARLHPRRPVSALCVSTAARTAGTAVDPCATRPRRQHAPLSCLASSKKKAEEGKDKRSVQRAGMQVLHQLSSGLAPQPAAQAARGARICATALLC